jgi:hypothetical protein
MYKRILLLTVIYLINLNFNSTLISQEKEIEISQGSSSISSSDQIIEPYKLVKIDCNVTGIWYDLEIISIKDNRISFIESVKIENPETKSTWVFTGPPGHYSCIIRIGQDNSQPIKRYLNITIGNQPKPDDPPVPPTPKPDNPIPPVPPPTPPDSLSEMSKFIYQTKIQTVKSEALVHSAKLANVFDIVRQRMAGIYDDGKPVPVNDIIIDVNNALAEIRNLNNNESYFPQSQKENYAQFNAALSSRLGSLYPFTKDEFSKILRDISIGLRHF